MAAYKIGDEVKLNKGMIWDYSNNGGRFGGRSRKGTRGVVVQIIPRRKYVCVKFVDGRIARWIALEDIVKAKSG